RPVHGVGAHDAAEEQHLGDQEEPHPEPDGALLLAEAVEVVGMVVARPVVCGTHACTPCLAVEIPFADGTGRDLYTTAAGRAYSYGPQTTTGVWSKLNGGGGLGVCHSRPVAR